MAGLGLSLLGPIGATLDDRPIEKLQSKRAFGLLFYLAVEKALGTESHNREALMELLWPGVDPDSSRVSLRQILYLLRRSVDDHVPGKGEEGVSLLLSDRGTVRLNPAYPLSSDVAQFNRLLGDSRESWPEAAALYRGDFLADFYLPDANPFETWAAARREAFRREVLDALDALTQEQMTQGGLEEAEFYGRRQIEIDHTRESAYRQLMQIYTWGGRRPMALSLFQELVDLLDQEYGTKPDRSTVELLEAIRAGQLPPPGDGESPVVAGLLQVDERAPVKNPYRGLRAFREEDARFFFGRELFAGRLVKEVARNPLVAVIGPSGSGKSSVIFAGLVPKLREAGGWAVASFRPGREPFQALSAALTPLLEPNLSETDLLVETRKLAAALEDGLLPLKDVVGRILKKEGSPDQLLLVADQLEELFTSNDAGSDHDRFIDLLLSEVKDGDSSAKFPLKSVFSLRADFMGQALAYRPLADALQAGDVKLGPMNHEELARAIEKPAGRQGASFEAGLIERIIEDVGDEPGNLPLLQFALTALWERRANGQLTHEAYDEIGQVRGAVARQADDFYQSLEDGQRKAARRVLIQMVRPGRHTADTRRIARRSEIGEGDWHLVQRLADARLVVTGRNSRGRETAELAHEALIRGWDRLSGWMEEDRAFRAWQERLRAAMGGWHASDCDDGGLLRGSPLVEAETWMAERRAQLSSDERGFVQISVQHRDRRRFEREKARAARERLRRRIIAGLAAGLVLVTALALFSFYQGRQAIQATNLGQQALSRQLATLALNSVDSDLDLAYLLSAEAYRRADTFQARNSLLSTINQHPQLVRYLHGQGGAVRAVAFSPEGDLVATGTSEGIIQLWESASGRALGGPLKGHQGIIISLLFSPDGRLLVTAGLDDSVRVWRVSLSEAQGDILLSADEVQPELEQPDVSGLAFSPDATLLVSGDKAGQLFFYDTREGSASFGKLLVAPIKLDIRGISAMVVSPDGRGLAVGGSDGQILLVSIPDNLRNGAGNFPVQSMGAGRPAHDANVTSLSFSPDGGSLVSGSFDGTVKVWDLESLAQVSRHIAGHDGWVTGLALTADGRLLATAGNDGRVLAWDSDDILGSGDNGEPLFTFPGHRDAVHSIAVSPDGKALMIGTVDGKAMFWNLSSDPPLARRLGDGQSSYAAVFTSKDSLLATTGGNRRDRIVLWDMDEDSSTYGQPLRQIPTGHDQIWTLAISQDDVMVAAGDEQGIVSVWDMKNGAAIRAPFQAHEDVVTGMSFSPEGVLASGSLDRSFTLLDLREHEEPASYSLDNTTAGNVRSINDIAISPDGKTLILATDGRWILNYELSALLKGIDLDTIASLSLYESPETRLTNVEFSPDGRFLAFGTIREVYLWSAHSGGPIWGPISDPSTGCPCMGALIFSADSRYLAFGTKSGTHLIDVAAGKRYDQPLTVSDLLVEHLSFSPNNLFLAASNSRRVTTIWDINPASWQERACRRANRNLSLEEWREFFGDEPYRETCPDVG